MLKVRISGKDIFFPVASTEAIFAPSSTPKQKNPRTISPMAFELKINLPILRVFILIFIYSIIVKSHLLSLSISKCRPKVLAEQILEIIAQALHRIIVACRQRFADLRWAGFSAQMLMRRTELPFTTKLSAVHETPPIANVLLAAGILFSFNILHCRFSKLVPFVFIVIGNLNPFFHRSFLS